MRHRIALAILTIVVLVASAFAGTARTQTEPLTIYAAASLTDVFRALDPAQKYSFAGSNTLETQIRNGAPADIFASAAPLNTQRLFGQGLVDKPVTFTSNRLALIVPKSNPADLHSVYDLKRKPVKLVICRRRRSGRCVYPHRAAQDGADLRPVQGREPGDRRPRCHGQGRTRAGRRGLRVRHGRACRERPGHGDPNPGVGAAARALRDRCRVQIDEEGGCSGMDQDTALAEGSGGAEGVRLPPAAQGQVLDGLFRATLVLATSVALLFLLLPIVAVFLRVPPSELVSALGSDAAQDALRVTGETITISMLAIILFGTPAAYWISTRKGALRDALVTLVELPLVLPPAVAGIGLLVAFGRVGLLGGTFDALGIDIAFTKIAVVLAVTFVASPFYLRTAIASFEVVDPTLPAAARTLGARPGRVFMRVMLPLARGGLGAGAALAFARGLGEFGATIMFAGSLQGVTQTLSLAIYEQFDIDFDVALAISALLIVLSAAVLLSVKLVTRWRSGSASLTLFAAFARRPT